MAKEKLTEKHIALMIKIAHGQRNGQYKFPGEFQIVELLNGEYVDGKWGQNLEVNWFLTAKGLQAIEDWRSKHGQREETETAE